MDLLVIRHAIAEDADAFHATGHADDLRPLTDEGRRKMTQGARGLQTLVPKIGLLASSPLMRARETAEIVAKRFGIDVTEETDTLRPGARLERFAEWATGHGNVDVLAVVGHEPHLSSLVAWLATGTGDARLDFKKGGACLLRFRGALRPGEGTLRWFCTPAILRALGG